MYYRVLFSSKGLAARYPPGLPLGKPLPPFAPQNVGAGRHVCHRNSSSMRIFARGMDSGGEGRRPLQSASVATQFRCRTVHAGSLADGSALFSSNGLAARYPPGPLPGKPLKP